MGYFEDRIREGMKDPEFRRGYEEAEAEIAALKARGLIATLSCGHGAGSMSGVSAFHLNCYCGATADGVMPYVQS